VAIWRTYGLFFTYEELKLAKGFEGIMLRDPTRRYKHGRSTLKEGGLAAIKRFVDAEAVIVDSYEQQENTNDKQINGRNGRRVSGLKGSREADACFDQELSR
jgi:hypothetical protein